METEYSLYAPVDALERFQHHDAQVLGDAAVYHFPWGHVKERRYKEAGIIWEMHVSLVEQVRSKTWALRFRQAHEQHVEEEMCNFLYWRSSSVINFDAAFPAIPGAAYFVATEDFRLPQLVRIWIAEQLLPILWPRVLFDVCGIPPSGWQRDHWARLSQASQLCR